MVWRWGKREIIYLSLHCHHQNDCCIKMGSDESHFYVSVGSDGQSHKSTNHNLFEEKESRSGIEPKSFYFKPAHKPYCWPPFVIPRGNSGKGAGLWMGLLNDSPEIPDRDVTSDMPAASLRGERSREG